MVEKVFMHEFEWGEGSNTLNPSPLDPALDS